MGDLFFALFSPFLRACTSVIHVVPAAPLSCPPKTPKLHSNFSPSFRNPPRDYDPKKTSFYETESSNYVKLLINALLGFLEGWPGWPGFARLERSSTSSAINPAAHTKAAPVRGRRPGRRDSGPTLSWSAPHRDSIPEPHLAQLCRPERGGSSLHRPSRLVTAETGGWPSERSRKAP